MATSLGFVTSFLFICSFIEIVSIVQLYAAGLLLYKNNTLQPWRVKHIEKTARTKIKSRYLFKTVKDLEFGTEEKEFGTEEMKQRLQSFYGLNL